MYRNPSPPPQENQNNVDRIGGTAYSQCWVLNALVSLSTQSLKADEQLSEELENEFCQLWDMSSDKQVGAFMLDKGVCDLMLAPLVRSTNYRVREVSLGVIGNLMCHLSSAKLVTDHSMLRTYIPTLMKEDDVSVLTETVRLLRAALSHDTHVSTVWLSVLPDDIVERLIHIIQSTLKMTSVRSKVLSEHCGHMLEILFYRDDKLLSNSAYTVFPIVDILQDRKSFSLQEPLLRCLQYLSDEERAVTNMTQCPGLPAVIHRVMSQKIEHSLVAVCLSLICTLLTSPATDEMCAWLEKDANITDTAIRTLQRILQDDADVGNEGITKEESDADTTEDTNGVGRHDTRNGTAEKVDTSEKFDTDTDTSVNTNKTPVENGDTHSPSVALIPSPSTHSQPCKLLETDTPTPNTSDRLLVTPSTPVRLVTPTYGTPCAVQTPTSLSNANTPQSTLSTPYSMQRRGIYTPSDRIRRITSQPSRPILQVCKEMCWSFLYTLANHIPTEGSCVLRYISDIIRELIECFKSGGDTHVELAMLYKQHLDKYPHFVTSSNTLNRFITIHTVLPGQGGD